MTSEISTPVLVCTLITWLIVFFSLFKGIKPLSYIVFPTFYIPAILIVIYMILGCTLDNAGEGLDMYFSGKNSDVSPKDALNLPDIWINAVAQVFFSLSLGVGVMTTYGSYNQKDGPIIRQSFIIALVDTLLSFLSGFFVFGVVGYLMEKIGFDAFRSYMGGSVLLYGSIPTAFAFMQGRNGWSLFFYLMVFLAGIDSSISYVETVVTFLLELNIGKKINRLGITLIVCLVGFLFSLAYCFNFSKSLIDATDYFLSAYFITFVAIMECFAIGWVFDFKERVVENQSLADPLLYLTAAYWGFLLIFGVLGYWVFFDFNYLAIVIFLVFFTAVVFYTKSISKLSWG